MNFLGSSLNGFLLNYIHAIQELTRKILASLLAFIVNLVIPDEVIDLFDILIMEDLVIHTMKRGYKQVLAVT